MAKVTIYDLQKIVGFTVINGNELVEYENNNDNNNYYYQAFYLKLAST